MLDMVTVMLGCALLDALPHSHVLEDGAHVVELDMRDDLRGPTGSLHGGLVAMLVDCAGASALASAGERRPVATSHASIDYLAAARIGPIRAVARALRTSESQGVAEVRVFDVGKDNRLVAAALVTASYLDGQRFVRTLE
jgi:uncharacterized protein (TIGR00369 family)